MNLNNGTGATTALTNATQANLDLVARNAKSAQKAREISKVEGAAKEFEAVFVSEMMKPMFEGLETDGMFGGGKGEEVFRGMLLQEYGKIVSETGGIGLADQVKQQMIMMQEQADNGS